MQATVLHALETRVQRDGARPLLTWYHPESGARVELSAVTFANWVDKACNLCGTLGVDDEPVLGLPLVFDHPGHWLSWVWVFAGWQAGGRVVVAPRDELGMVDLAVLGPEHPVPVPGVETVACSLHPLGLGFGRPLPGVTDAHEILSEPDVHLNGAAPAEQVWWTGSREELTGAALAGLAPVRGRSLVVASSPEVMLDALVGALVGGGSLVVVDGSAPDDRVEAIATAERAAR
ncbi:TIGR03089 family protein [Aestuariimicrobium sp. T2.26MG-19.2B]|uniref:TIGR03089 family protein n=1 Tax=Aestuariimicrobium sp. T2.26MG-19.2B TaxID=3040679 RepID=UPI0024778AB1|nr:TIGR03089 family protein [Aestuariimicrobium sp. T2.26MG-19.2B]CAI9407433.1 hypothetical protein AESSP_01820 [Aestuariimicrobium sp. T2.26MG-19.2B]